MPHSDEFVIGSLAAYGLSRFDYKFGPWRNRDIAFFFLSQLILPPVVLAMPFLVLYKGLALLDTKIGLVLVYTLMVLPIVMLLDFVPPRLVGIGSGLLNTCWLLGGLVAPGVLGRLIDATGSFPAAFVGCAILAPLALGAVALVTEPVAAPRPGRGEDGGSPCSPGSLPRSSVPPPERRRRSGTARSG